MKSECTHPVILGNNAGGYFCGSCNKTISRYYVRKHFKRVSDSPRKPKKVSS